MEHYLLKVFLLFALAFCAHPLFAIDDYQAGDTLYIWAKSGLKVRSTPNLNADVTSALPFGSKVELLATTEAAFNTKVDAQVTEPDTGPIILKGHWAKIKDITTGETGYVADQYLLRIRPSSAPGLYAPQIPAAAQKVDTIYYNKMKPNTTGNYIHTHTTYAKGVEATLKVTDKGNLLTARLEGYSIEEAFMLITQHRLDTASHPTLHLNWKEQLIIQVELCEYTFIQQGETVVVHVLCAC